MRLRSRRVWGPASAPESAARSTGGTVNGPGPLRFLFEVEFLFIFRGPPNGYEPDNLVSPGLTDVRNHAANGADNYKFLFAAVPTIVNQFDREGVLPNALRKLKTAPCIASFALAFALSYPSPGFLDY
jgi:hypothetical protein